MKMNDLLLIGAIGLGAYFLFVKKASAATPETTTASTTTASTSPPQTTTISLTPEIKVDVPTISVIPSYYSNPTTLQTKSNITFSSAQEAVAASKAPAVTAKTISIAGSYAVSPYSTYRKNI